MSTNTKPDNNTTAEFDRVRSVLAEYSTEAPGLGMSVAHHEVPANRVSIPVGMATSKAAKILVEAAAEDAAMKEFSRTFKYRPWDGAVALHRVLENYFGTTGRGVGIPGFFGTSMPEERTIEISTTETVQVPWGMIEFAPLEGVLMLGGARDEEYGLLFGLTIQCPKKYSASVAGLFNLLEHELSVNSIYKGKAIRGTDEPRFMDLHVDPALTFNEEVYDSLYTSVWGVLQETELLRSLGKKVDPKILLHGPFGTGKTEAGVLTAKVAVDNGWTFIMFNSGKATQADLEKTLQTARLLSPAVVFIEDLDIYAANNDEKAQTRMLELFDGISSKGHEVMVLMTSNHPANFSKGMLRAGRINKMIEIGALNREASEKLIRKVNGERLGEVDFDKIFKAIEGYEPAFVRQTFEDAGQAAALRHAKELREAGEYTLEKARDFKLTTVDFVTAANIMRPQHHQHGMAGDSVRQVTLDDHIIGLLEMVLTKRLALNNSNIGNIDIEVLDLADIN
jgi:transitional endoplasmic reticulum ATPase